MNTIELCPGKSIPNRPQSPDMDSHDDDFFEAIFQFLFQKLHEGRSLRLADQPAKGCDVLSVQERQPAALHGVNHGFFHSGVIVQQGADFLGVAVHGRGGQPDRRKLYAGLGLGAPQTEARQSLLQLGQLLFPGAIDSEKDDILDLK